MCSCVFLCAEGVEGEMCGGGGVGRGAFRLPGLLRKARRLLTGGTTRIRSDSSAGAQKASLAILRKPEGSLTARPRHPAPAAHAKAIHVLWRSYTFGGFRPSSKSAKSKKGPQIAQFRWFVDSALGAW